MFDIIDRSEHLKSLNVSALQTLTIEKDKHTPHREHTVHVTASDISLGLGSSILIQDHALLSLASVVAGDVLGTIDIGSNGGLALNSDVGLNLLSNIAFTATHGTAVLILNDSKINLSGNISGFGANDVIRMNGVNANSAVWTQGLLGSGTLALYNSGGTEVGSIGLNGTYTSADFDVKEYGGKNQGAGSRITFVSPSENGFAVPGAAAAPANSAASFAGSMRDLQAVHAPMTTNIAVGGHHA